MVTTVTSRVLTRFYALVTIATSVTGLSSVKGILVWRENSFKRAKVATKNHCQLRHARPNVTIQ